jgi:quercetin dioxygenase-like cupin family protein
MKRILLLCSLALLLIVSTRWIGEAQQPPPGGAADNTPRFTGNVTSLDGKELSIGRRRFEAGARTAWHSHDRGQLLMVEEGRMRTQKRGQAMKEFGVGESEYTAPNVVHWHGAASGQPLVQLNVGFGGGSKWLEDVADDEYAGKKK